MKSLWWFLILTGIIWIVLVPVWQTPDEQIHFGQATFVSEKWRNPEGQELDYSGEIDLSTSFLGTQRDKSGNNLFTHHPEYKIEYSDTYEGIYEAEISELKNSSARSTFVKKESSRYPPLYYYLAAVVLKLFSYSDLFTRVIAVRFLNLGIFMTTLYVFWSWAKKIFKNNPLLTSSLVLLIGLQPMFVFSSIGVTSDTLGNLIFAGYIYFMTLFVIDGLSNKRNIFWFIFLTLLAPLIKPQFIISVPLSLMFLAGFMIFKYRQRSVKPILGLIIIGGLIFIIFMKTNLGPATVVSNLKASFTLDSFIKYSFEYTFSHTYREVLPWYWGVYKWLGVTYPRIVHRLVNLVTLVSLIGFGTWLIKKIRRQTKDRTLVMMMTLGSQAVLFYVALSIYDWLSWSMTGYQLGIQGRYLYPTIGIHMLLILIGWQHLWPQKLKSVGIKMLVMLMLILNLTGLWTISNTYYDLSSLNTFIIQSSQYKPEIFKGYGLVLLLIIYTGSMVFFMYRYLRQKTIKQSVKMGQIL